jgi:hypothetical protein
MAVMNLPPRISNKEFLWLQHKQVTLQPELLRQVKKGKDRRRQQMQA